MAAKFSLLLAIKTSGSAAIKRMGNSMQGLQGKVKNLSLSLKGLQTSFAPLLAIVASGATVAKIFGDTATLEKQAKSLEVLTGSSETAARIIKELQAFGSVTPFESTDLIETAKRLNAFGVETERVVSVTKRLSDVSGATGAKLNEVANVYGKVVAKGRLQGEELLQFQERGIALQDELRKMYNLTGEEFSKAVSKGRISAEAVEVAFGRLTQAGGKYADGAIAQSDTLSGKFSTLMDSVTVLAQTIGEIFTPVFKWLFDSTTAFLNFLTRAINKFKAIRQAEEEILENVSSRRKFFKDGGRKLIRERTEEILKELNSSIDTSTVDKLIIPALKGAKGALEDTFGSQMQSKLKTFNDSIKSVGESMADVVIKGIKGMEDALVEFVSGGKLSFRDLANSIIKDMIRIQIQQSITGPLSSFIGSLFPGPKAQTSFSNRAAGRATGGPVSAGTSYLVGERGMEIFTPRTSGNITPNNKLGGTNVVVNVDASGTEVQGDEQQGRALGQLIAAAVQSELVQQSRPGGILNPA